METLMGISVMLKGSTVDFYQTLHKIKELLFAPDISKSTKFPMDLSGQNERDKWLVGVDDVKYQQNKWCMLKPDADLSDTKKLADNINYACTFSDCTALGYGSSCGGLDTNGNASYAFHMFFQMFNQSQRSCNFQGLAMVTDQNISQSTCNFTIQIASTSSSWKLLPWSLAFMIPFMILFI